MLEGLEISEVKFSKIESDDKKRLDSDFFKKKYVIATNKITKRDYYLFIDLIEKLTDFHANGSYEIIANFFTLLDFKDYAYMLRTVDLEAGNYTENVKYIDKNCYHSLKKSQLFGKELIINKIGNPGRTYLAPSLKVPMSLGMNLFMVTLKKNSDVNTDFLYVYFNIEIGKNIIQRQVNGTVPLTIDKNSIKCLLIPKFSKVFYDCISDLVRNVEIFKSSSKTLYQQAEDILLEELGLTNFIQTQQAVNIKSIKESFEATGRLDAEYYQPKYEDYISLIKNYKAGYEILRETVNIKNSNFIPKINQQYNYVELSNIGNMGDITGCTQDLGSNLPSRARRLIKNGDVVVSSIEGSLESCALVTESFDNAICSTGFYVINSKKINSETLLVLFKSSLMQNILKQNCSGTILTAINKEEFYNLPIPLINTEIQSKIASLIQESFALKSQSEQLLTIAKQAVEMAIEFDEETAMQFIKENTNNIDLIN